MAQDRYMLAWPSLTSGIKLLLVVNGSVFALNAILAGALIPLAGLSWSGLEEWYGLGMLRLLSYQFVHSWSDPWHIVFNMLMLYFFGTMVEEHVGKRRLIVLYLTSGVLGGILHVALSFVSGQQNVPLVGASAAVFGILVYATFLAPRSSVIFVIFPLELWMLTAILVAGALYMKFVELRAGVGATVSHAAHLGGALWGALAFKADRPGGWWHKVAAWRRDRERRGRYRRQEILDRLLEKVHQRGMDALSGSERRFLRRASQEMKRR